MAVLDFNTRGIRRVSQFDLDFFLFLLFNVGTELNQTDATKR